MSFNVFQIFITRDLRSRNIQLYFQKLTQLIIYFLISFPLELQELLSWRFINTLCCSTICSACLLTSGCLWNHTHACLNKVLTPSMEHVQNCTWIPNNTLNSVSVWGRHIYNKVVFAGFYFPSHTTTHCDILTGSSRECEMILCFLTVCA